MIYFYITRYQSNIIRKYNLDGTYSSEVAVESDSLDGITVDSDGNIFVANGAGIRKITPDGDVSTFATIPGAMGITIDSQNNLFCRTL